LAITAIRCIWIPWVIITWTPYTTTSTAWIILRTIPRIIPVVTMAAIPVATMAVTKADIMADKQIFFARPLHNSQGAITASAIAFRKS